jgi:hypothetical protein
MASLNCVWEGGGRKEGVASQVWRSSRLGCAKGTTHASAAAAGGSAKGGGKEGGKRGKGKWAAAAGVSWVLSQEGVWCS